MKMSSFLAPLVAGLVVLGLSYNIFDGDPMKGCQKIVTPGFGIEALCPNGIKHTLPFDKKTRTYPEKYTSNSKEGICVWNKIKNTWTCRKISIPCIGAQCSLSKKK